MRPERAPKQTLLSSVEFGKGQGDNTQQWERTGQGQYRDTLNHWSRTLGQVHITGIFLVITMATTYPEKKMKKNSFTYSKVNRVPSP